MGAARPAGARHLLALTLCLAAGAAQPDGRTPGRKVLPPPSNLHYSFGLLCKLKWTWDPPEGIDSGCDLKYYTDFLINGIPKGNGEWTRNLFREEYVPLNEEVHFKVRSECTFENISEPSDWVEISTLPKGAAGTEAVGIKYIWHDLEYIACTWLPGPNASASTNYALYYWYEGMGNPQQCQNYIYKDAFGCIFNLSVPNSTYMYPIISILIRGNSEEIRPVCVNENPTTFVKPGPPRNVTVSKVDNELNIEWQKPGTFPSACLAYQVELKDSKSNSTEPYEVKQSTNFRFPSVHPNAMYIVKVRAMLEAVCYNNKYPWSDWSEEKSTGEKTDSTVYLVLILIVPLIVAIATVILLVYLKRLKILIYPQIPDPRKIIKRMFGEQNEDFQSCSGDDFLNVCIPDKEEIHFLVCIENPESSTSENKDQKCPALQVKAM